MVTHQGGADGQHRTIKYRPDIDGLRAVAVTSVVAYHCGLGWMLGGFVGVDVFFVISGYLIGSLVYKEIRDGSFSLAKFYARRVKRILPALFGVVLITYVAGFLLLVPLELRGLSASALAAIASSSNFFFLRHALNYFGADTSGNPLLMTWTLGVEEQFYLFFPLLMLLMRGKRWQVQVWAVCGAAALSLTICIWGSSHFPVFAFYMLPTRAWELGCGVLLAMVEANRRSAKNALPPFAEHVLSVAGVALIVVSVGVLDKGRLAAGYEVLWPVVGTVLLIASREGVINRVLAWRPIVFVGLISYSWYLWHWPLLSFAQLSSSSDLSSEVAVAIGMLSFGCAVLSYFLIERPFRRSTTPTKTLLWRYGGVACVMMVPAAAFFVSDGLPKRNQKAQELESAMLELEQDKCQVWEQGSQLPLRAPCVPPGSEHAVALIGDSHAAEMALALRDSAGKSGYRLIELTKANCPPLGE